jgi:uncharacterized repeat protein (TIGR02543 family)
MRRFDLKRVQLTLRAKISPIVVAALLGSLLGPITQLTVPALQEQAVAAVTNGSMQISTGGQQQINLPGAGISANGGFTLESWVNFSTVATSNQIFRGWTFSTSSRVTDLNWSSTGLITWYPDQLSGSQCSIQTKAPVAGTWYNLSLVVDPYTDQNAGTSKVFLNGNLLRVCRLSFMRQNGAIQGVQLGGSTGSAMRMSAVRISSTARYSTQNYSNTQTTTYSTSADSNVWALFNTVYDDASANSCLTNSDPGSKLATLTTVSGTVSCSSSAPASPTTAVNGSISLSSGATAVLDRFGGGNIARTDRHIPTDGYTWEGWIKFSTIASGLNTIFKACSNGSTTIAEGCNTILEAYWNSTNGAVNFSFCSNVSTGVVPTTNQWYHIAVSVTPISGGSANNYLFINGELRATCAGVPGAYNGGVEGFRIGGTAGTTMKIGPTRYRSGQAYTSSFAPSRTYPTNDGWYLLNTQYDNYDLCLRNTDPYNKISPYATIGGTATCSDDAPNPPASSLATLSSATIKGVTPTLGTPNSTLASATAGTVNLTVAQATSTSLTSTFTRSDAAGATVKIVKYSSGVTADTANFDAAADLTSGTTTTVSDNDYFIIKVTAEDGTTINYYRINVVVPSNISTLSALALSSGTLSPTFASATTSYTASVANSVTSITATPTRTQANATITVNGTAVTSGSASGAISLNVGSNTITIVGRAQDGTTTSTYTVTVTRLSSDATLSALALSAGALSPTFASGTTTYTLSVGNAVTSTTVTPTRTQANATITVNGISVNSGSASGAIALSVGLNTITVIVTAQDGTTTGTYTVNVTRAASNVSTLSALALSSGTLSPTFVSGTTSYSSSVANAVTSITVTPTRTQANATITVNGTAVTSGLASGAISLNVGLNTITVVVTAQDGTTTSTYTVNVTRAVSNVSTLSALALSSGTLSPIFASGTLSYTTSVANAVTSITVTPTRTEANATTVQYLGASGTDLFTGALAVGPNVIRTVVTAQDGTTTSTYTLTVTRLSNDATLSALALSSGTLSPTFASGTSSYTTSVANAVTSITVTPTRTQANATITVNGVSVTSGSASGAISLSVGSNTITVVVAAQDGTTGTYTVTVTRAAITITATNVLIAAPAVGATPQTSTSSNGQFTTTITWSGTPTTFAAATAYTATVTVIPNTGYTLSGVSANFFTLNGNAATSANLANAGVFEYLFPATTPAPTISNLDQTLPNYGSTVNVTGTNLSGATVVKIGNTAVATFTVISATSLSFVVNSACCTTATISITTPGGTVTSVATITPQPQLAVIATQPVAVSKNVGQSVTFSVAVTAPLDGGLLSYQWIKGATPIQGATSATLTFTPTAVSQAGNYYVAVYNSVSGSTSLVASNTATLSLNKATPVLSAFAAVNKTFGDAPFTITAPTSSVPGGFTYQSGTTSVATVNGSTVTIVGQGSSVITATFIPENTDDYVSNGTITMTLTVTARQLVTPTVPTVVVTAATLKSFTVSWTAVSNAVAYSLRIHANDGVTLLRTVSSLSGTSKLVTATEFPTIADGTSYKIGLVATGDANNTDSALSALASVTTNSQYTITYNTTNSTGGTAPAAATFITGSTPYLISANTGNLVRTAFSFSGWNTAADGTGTTYLATGLVSVSPTANLVLYPKWTALKFTVTYYGNNNSGGTAPTDSTEYLNGASLTVSSVGTLVRNGYNFTGWTTDSANTSSVIAASSTITINLANVQLYAKWQVIPYTVTYNSQGGSSVINGSYTVGGTLTLPADPTRAGYTFSGWFLASSGGTALVSPYSPPSTGALTLFAQWTPIQYTVRYNGNLSVGGTAPVNSATYTVGSSIPVVGNTGALTRTGYTFSDWALNSQGTGTVYAAGSSLPVGTSNVTLYARWIATPYSVTYNTTSSTGGSAPTDTTTYTIGQNVPVRGNLGSLVRTGYTFGGWTDNPEGTGTVYQSANNYVVGATNISFHPKWTPNNYTITYNKNGASGLPTASTATYTTGGDAVTLTSVGTMAKTGFNFGGWSTTSTGSAISGTYTTTADVILYAVWTIKSLTVTYSEGSATRANLSGFPANLSGNYGTTITLNATVSATTVIDSAQHAFMGWSDGSSVYQGGSSYLLGETSPTFTALWAKIFAVRYTFNGGTPAAGTSDTDSECLAAGSTCTDGQVITANAAPTRTGYTFAGWVDQNNVAVSGSTFTVASNRYLLYATWTPVNYAITYNTAGGSTAPTTFTRQLGQSFTVAAAPTKTGHTFTGWNDGTTVVNPGVNYNVSTSPVTLTAQWTTNVYTVSYDANGGSGTAIANVSFTYGANAISLPSAGDLTRTNFTFAGWSETPSGTALTGSYTPTMSRTLYVVWTVSQYLVTYSGNGGTPSTASATYTAASTPLVLPTATRANFTLQGWYSAATDGVLLGAAGANYAPASATTIYARWIQDSLVGVPASSLSFISSYAVNPAITATNTFSTADSAVSLRVPAGSLPAGTTVTNWLLSSDEYARALLPGQNNYLLSLVVSWLNADGTVPVAPNSNPLVMTITNSLIKAGARVYSVVGNTSQLLGVATQDGSVSVNLTTDPQIYVLQAKPSAPTNVTATSGEQSSSFVSWTASADDGGSTIINYTVTASDGQRCISSTTSCNFGGLTNGTRYTFTVYASNGVGNSDQSTASASITPGTAPAIVVPTTPGATTPEVTTPVAPVPVRAVFVKAQVPPQIRKTVDKFICTPGTYNTGFTLDGVIEQGTTSVFTPVSYIYNLLFNQIIQRSLSVATTKSEASWDLKLAPAGTLVTCSVTATGNSLTVTESSIQNTTATNAALVAQKQSISSAEADYKAALSAIAKNYQKVLVDNRANWRADIAKNKATYDAEVLRIKNMGASKSKTALSSAALKTYIATQKKITAEYKESGPAAVKARDLSSKAALDTRNAAVAKANSVYGSFIESIGSGVLVP